MVIICTYHMHHHYFGEPRCELFILSLALPLCQSRLLEHHNWTERVASHHGPGVSESFCVLRHRSANPALNWHESHSDSYSFIIFILKKPVLGSSCYYILRIVVAKFEPANGAAMADDNRESKSYHTYRPLGLGMVDFLSAGLFLWTKFDLLWLIANLSNPETRSSVASELQLAGQLGWAWSF